MSVDCIVPGATRIGCAIMKVQPTDTALPSLIHNRSLEDYSLAATPFRRLTRDQGVAFLSDKGKFLQDPKSIALAPTPTPAPLGLSGPNPVEALSAFTQPSIPNQE